MDAILGDRESYIQGKGEKTTLINVLFVCLGNICRSPMAEAVFRKKVQERGLEQSIHVDSAGTGDWHVGKKPHVGTQQKLTKYEIDFEGIHARQVNEDDWRKFDYIIAMDESNVTNLNAWKKDDASAKCHRMLDFLPEEVEKDVEDPYYTGNFARVYDLIDRASDKLLDHIQKQ